MRIRKLIESKGENSQTFFNFLSTVITSGVVFITMPIFTRMLGTEQYGYYAIYHAWLTIFVCFMGFNISACLGTGFYRFKEKYYELKSSILLEGILISLIIIVLLSCAYPIIKPAFGYSIWIFLLLLVHSFANFITNVASGGWVYEKRAAWNMIMSATLLISTSLISILLLATWNSSKPMFYGRVLGTAVPHIIIAAAVCIIILRKAPAKYNREYWIYGMHFGLPMVFHTLSHQVLGQSDRIMMQWFSIPASEIGIYSFFYSFVAILSTILNALNTSWVPFLYDDLNKENYEILNKKIRNYVELFVIMSLGFLLLSHDVMKVFANSDYWSGSPLVPVLVMTIYCTFFYQFAVNYEFFKEKPKYVAIGTISAAAINIVLNIWMIPIWGMYGAAAATLASYTLLAIMHLIIVKTWKNERRYPLSYKPVVIGLIMVMIGCASYYFIADWVVFRWAVALALALYLVVKVRKRRTIF